MVQLMRKLFKWSYLLNISCKWLLILIWDCWKTIQRAADKFNAGYNWLLSKHTGFILRGGPVNMWPTDIEIRTVYVCCSWGCFNLETKCLIVKATLESQLAALREKFEYVPAFNASRGNNLINSEFSLKSLKNHQRDKWDFLFNLTLYLVDIFVFLLK
jgi:hypothetical protein